MLSVGNRRRFREFKVLFVKDALDVLRDRRAAFLTFIFPVLLYPILFPVMGKVRSWNRRFERDTVSVGLVGDYDDFHDLMHELDGVQFTTDLSGDLQTLLREHVDAIIEFDDSRAQEGFSRVVVRYDGAQGVSREAFRRVMNALELYRVALLERRFDDGVSRVPVTEMVVVNEVDASDSNERGEALLGRILPAVIVLLLVAGGAFVAIDTLAGEKERGTLETLLIHPVSPGQIALAKFSVVFVCSIVAVLLNLMGMFAAHSLGWGVDPALADDLAMPGFRALVLVAVLLLPLAVLSSAVLLAVSARARSFREAQTFLVPVVLMGLIPALIAAMPNVELNVMTAWIPVCSVALALRDAVAGETDLVASTLAFATTALYATLSVRYVAGLLLREETILGGEIDPLSEEMQGRREARRVIAFAVTLLLALYYVAPLLQSPDGWLGIQAGLALMLWGVVLAPALVYARVCKLDWRETLALRIPRLRDSVVTVGLAVSTAVLVAAYSVLQTHWLPFPQDLERAYESLFDLSATSWSVLLFVFVLSPAICEEVLWRGVFQGELERRGRPWRTAIVVAVFFGLFHFSVHRFVPTALVGLVLAGVRLRGRSLVNCVIFHASYNATVVFLLARLVDADAFLQGVVFHPASLLLAAGAAFLFWRALGRRRPDKPANSSCKASRPV